MNKLKELTNKILQYKVVKWILIAIVVNFICDVLTQRSLIEAIIRVFTNPLNFIYNLAFIFLTISFCYLFKKRKFALSICLILWISIALTNFIVQCFRNTPFSFVDILILPSVITVIDKYFNVLHYILIGLLIGLIIFGLVILYKKDKGQDRIVKTSLISFVSTLLFIICFKGPFVKVGAISNDYSNLTIAYEDYGLPYCFVTSIYDMGVDKPDEYDKELLDECLRSQASLYDQIDKNDISEVNINSENKPNVIFLQLESFMDAENLIKISTSQSATPTFTYLKENYPSGSLIVPSVGAGTANVEFEIMTGMSLDYFGAGEYPYKTELDKQTTETIGYLLKNHGYYSTVIHNNRASFYDREGVFPNMGYDRFVSSEFMVDLEYNETGWIKDKVLTNEIFKALDSSTQKDFIYTISVQPHGKYSSSEEDVKDLLIDVNSLDEKIDEDLVNQYKYYVNQLYEVDLVLKDIIEKINEYDENIMLVVYGDHLPDLNLSNEDTKLNDIYKSEYVIYTNYDIELEDKDLYTYQLTSHVLRSISCYDGIMNKLHLTRDNNDQYREHMQILMYDMFSDNKYVWDGTCPYETTEMLFGYNDTVIENVFYQSGRYVIKGKNFNESSRVYFNGNRQDTIYIDSNTLFVEGEEKSTTNICVKQVYLYTTYTSSNIYSYTK